MCIFRLKHHCFLVAFVAICHHILPSASFLSLEDRKALFYFTVELLPYRVLQHGSNLTVTCMANGPASLAWMPSLRVRQLPRRLLPVIINPDNASASALFVNVSAAEYNKATFDCVGVASNGHEFTDVSLHKELLVGYPPVMPRFTFYWLDRRDFYVVARPALSDVERATGIAPVDGGRLKLTVWYWDIFTDEEGRKCASKNYGLTTAANSTAADSSGCVCDSEGRCDWGRKYENMMSENMTVNISLCNEIDWCAPSEIWTFDRRDKEQPLAVRDLNAKFSPDGISVDFREPTVTNVDQQYIYSVQLLVLTADGSHTLVDSLTTNETHANFSAASLRPATDYAVRVDCRPRFFAGHAGPQANVTSRTPEAAPCAPPELALLLPAEGMAGAALPPADCRNGVVRRFLVAVNNSTPGGHSATVDVPEVAGGGGGREFVAWNATYPQSARVSVSAATAAGVGPSAAALEASWLVDCAESPSASDVPILELQDVAGNLSWRGVRPDDPPRLVACETASVDDQRDSGGGGGLSACLRVWKLLWLTSESPTLSVVVGSRVRLARLLPGAAVCRCRLAHSRDAAPPTFKVSADQVDGVARLDETASCRGQAHVERISLRWPGHANRSRCHSRVAAPRVFDCRPLPSPAPPFAIVEGWRGDRLVLTVNVTLSQASVSQPNKLVWTAFIGIIAAISLIVWCKRRLSRQRLPAARTDYMEPQYLPVAATESEAETEETRLTRTNGNGNGSLVSPQSRSNGDHIEESLSYQSQERDAAAAAAGAAPASPPPSSNGYTQRENWSLTSRDAPA